VITLAWDGRNTAHLHRVNASVLCGPCRTLTQIALCGSITEARSMECRRLIFGFQQQTLIRKYWISGAVHPLRMPVKAAWSSKLVNVSHNLLSVLGNLNPLLGRGFSEYEEKPGPDQVALLSYGFGSDSSAGTEAWLVGQITLDNKGYSVVGVMLLTLSSDSA